MGVSDFVIPDFWCHGINIPIWPSNKVNIDLFSYINDQFGLKNHFLKTQMSENMNIPSGWTSTHYDTSLRPAFFIKLCFQMLFKRRMRTSRNSRWMNRRRSSSLRGKSLFSFYFLLFFFFCKWIKCAYWIQFLRWKKIFLQANIFWNA